MESICTQLPHKKEKVISKKVAKNKSSFVNTLRR